MLRMLTSTIAGLGLADFRRSSRHWDPAEVHRFGFGQNEGRTRQGGICKGNRIKVSTFVVGSSPCWTVTAACRLAGQMITRSTASAIPAKGLSYSVGFPLPHNTSDGQPPADATESVSSDTSRWLTVGLRAGSQKDSTKSLYATLARVHIVPSQLGKLGLGQVRPSDVQAFILALKGSGKSESTVRQIYTVLRAIFQSALEDGMVARNVVAAVKRPAVTHRETHSLTPAEVLALLEQTDTSSYGLIVRLMAYTGLRRGEAVALRWEDVDLELKTINVRGTTNRVSRVGLV